MDQFRSHTAPAVLRDNAVSEVPVVKAVEAAPFSGDSVDRPEYYEFYHDSAPEGRVGFPTPRFWSRFAGRLPPRHVIQRLHSETAKERLIDRLRSTAEGTHVDPVARPDTLVDLDAAVAATHTRQLRTNAPAYRDEDPPTRAASEDREGGAATAVEAAPLKSPSEAHAILRRFALRYLATSRAQRVLAARHLLMHLSPTQLFGSDFFILEGMKLADQLSPAAYERFIAYIWEYELRLHGENYASQVLCPTLDGKLGLRRASLATKELSEIVDATASVLEEFRRHPCRVEAFFGAEMTAFRRALKHFTKAVVHKSSVMTIDSSFGPADHPASAAVPRKVVQALQQQVLSRSAAALTSSSSPPSAAPTRPLDDEELQAQKDWGLDMTVLDDPDEKRDRGRASSAAAATTASAPFDQTPPLFIPSEWEADLNDDPQREIWGADFQGGGGFVNLDALRRRGETGALVQPPSSNRHVNVNAVCVICELDAVNLKRCPCGNGVHEDCGAVVKGMLRCCRTCSESSWDVRTS